MKHGTGDSYETPDALYEALDDIFNFKVDAFADSENAKCDIYMSEKDSALDQEWPDCGSVWMNPPYSRELIKRCTQKAYEESVVVPDRYIIALVRDDPTTKWYDQFIDGKAAELWRLKHRLTFKGLRIVITSLVAWLFIITT